MEGIPACLLGQIFQFQHRLLESYLHHLHHHLEWEHRRERKRCKRGCLIQNAYIRTRTPPLAMLTNKGYSVLPCILIRATDTQHQAIMTSGLWSWLEHSASQET